MSEDRARLRALAFESANDPECRAWVEEAKRNPPTNVPSVDEQWRAVTGSDPHVCADCGATVERLGIHGWGREVRPGVHDFCCRMVLRDATLLSADYHYVDGEVQRRWRLPETSGNP